MRKNRSAALVAAVAATALAGSELAHATNFVWSGSAAPDTSWSNPSNWTNLAAPSASSDTITFDDSGVAALPNTVDAGLAITTFSKITYSQTNPANIYTTTIPAGMTLSLLPIATSNSPAPANASLLLMPATGATASNATGTVLKIVGGAGSKLSLTGGGSFAVAVTGRPLAAAVANESFAVLDMSGLDQFVMRTDLGAGSFTNSNFGIGAGNVSTGDRGAWSGKVILANNSTIDVNRLSVGGQHDAGTSQNTPNSLLVLGQTNAFETNVSGTIYVGSDPNLAPREPSGGIIFRGDLVNPTLTTGIPASTPNMQVGSARNSVQNGSHNAFGVFDMTSASGGAEGSWTGAIGNIRIGDGYNVTSTSSPSTGGGHGMMSTDKGQVDVGSIIIASTRAAGNAGVTDGQLNVGLKGKATDAGQGTVNISANLFVGQRNFQSNGIANGVVNIANSGAVNADRVFLADNTSADFVGGVNSTVGIVNLDGGTLTTGQIQAGSDTTQLGTKNTRLMNFNGGVLKVKTGTTRGATYMQGLTAANVYPNGGTINTNGQNVAIDQALVAPSGDGLGSVSVSFGGSGYRVAPIVSITPAAGDTTGAGATAVAQIDGTGTVTGITVTNPGTNYTAAPTINLIANSGTSTLGITTPFGGSAATLTPILATNVNSGGITKVGAGVLSLTGSNTYGGATTVAAGTLKVNTTAATPLLNNAAGTDIKGGRVVFDYTAAADQTAYKGNLKSLLHTGYGSNFATGQIHSSTATSQIGLGYNDDSASSSFTVARAYYGDGNLDGTVDTTDFNVLATNFNKSGQDWVNGDFNYDGVVNALDFNSVATNYGSSLPVAAPALGALVPEPASITLIGLAGVALVRRRRH